VLRAVVFAAALLGAASCKKTAPTVSENDEAPSVAVAEAPKATPAVAATPAPDPLAPPGTFFLLQQTSVTTEDGIIGFKPGQVVREVTPGTYLVGTHTMKLDKFKLTNNLRIAGQLAAQDAASQEALRQAIRARSATPVPTYTQTPTYSNGPATTPSTVVASAPPPEPRKPASTIVAGAGSKPVDNSPRLGGGTGFADPETGNRRAEKTDSSGRRYWRDSHGNIRYDF
jgi:hypothetical protein